MSGSDRDRQESVTRLLLAVRDGREGAMNQLVPLVYEELHEIARRHRRRWHGDYTLNTTGLLHEAYLKLLGQNEPMESRAHFMAVASKAMRHLLVDQARRRDAAKRGGDVDKISLDQMVQEPAVLNAASEQKGDELIALDEALNRLSEHNARQSHVVECRFFGGMTIDETAAALSISPATVKLDWAQARRWLYRAMRD